MRRRWRVLLAVFLILGAFAAVWFYPRPRVITVCVFTDSAFRQRDHWHAVLNSRLQTVSRIYERQVGIRWKIADANLADPTANFADLDSRRAALAQKKDCPADLMLSITGLTSGSRTASVTPFSHAAIVVDQAQQTELRNTLILAHELAHLFGAVHDAGSATLMADKPANDTFSPRTIKLIRSLRDYDFAQGVSALEGRWGNRAVSALSEMLTGLSTNPGRQAHQILAAALAADGRNSSAVTQLQAAVKCDPKSVQARFELAVALERNSQDDLALATLRQGVTLNPGSARLHSALGAALLKRDREEAIDEFMTSLRLDPSNAPVYAVLGGVLSSGMGQTDAAILAYRNALRLAPGMAEAQQGLAQALASKQKAESDVLAKRREAAQNPGNSEAIYDLGVAEARVGNFDAAAQAFESSIRLQPAFGSAHSSLAMICYLRRDYAGAWKEVNAARKAGSEPDPAFVNALMRKMRR